MSDENPGNPPASGEPQPPVAPPAPSAQNYGHAPPPGVPEKASGKSVTAMILGIVGIVLCQPVGIAAWIIGHQERKEIAAGKSPAAGQGMATAGWIMGIIGTAMLVLGLLILILVFTTIGFGVFSGLESGGFEGEFF